jgi:LysR family nitrogen assimilation transcriptional regulator
MELRQFKYFVAIVDSGSVSQAARTLFVAQSALSKQISDLESELDAQLLERTSSGVHVTETGKIFYEYSLAILKQIDDVRAAVKSSENHIVGNVVIAIPQSVSNALALPLSLASRQALSGINLHMNEELAGNLIDLLQQGRADMAILTDNVALAGMRQRKIVKEELFLISAVDYPLAPGAFKDGMMSLEAVLELDLVMSGRKHCQFLRAILEEAASQQRLVLHNVVAEINSVHILKNAVLAGIGCTLFPKAIIAAELAQGRLQAHRIGPSGLFRTLVLCASKSIPMTNPKRAVARLVLDVIADLCRSGQWPGAVALAGPDGNALFDEDGEQYQV